MIQLHEATQDDLPLMMAWRSNPLVFQGFYTQRKPLTWEEHIQWWESRNQDWRTFIMVYQKRPIGVITIGQLDHWSPEIGYYVGEVSLWDKGFGREAVRLGLNWLRKYGKTYCHTTVLNDNHRSIKLLKSFGFKYYGKARQGESWYQVEL